jgi:2,3-bisphosphoglycerate-dependent phosphoglycerate mutase
VYECAVSYFKKEVMPAIKGGKNVVFCAHQGSLRALVKYVEDIHDKDIMDVNFSTGELVRYYLSEARLVKENAAQPEPSALDAT